MQTFTPKEYLMIDVAGNFGLDKESWTDRLTWFQTNELLLEDLVKEAEEPALFYAGVQAYRTASQGKAISYPISLDATASGAQILAILVGCSKSASLCNVLSTGEREDLYTNIYEIMCARLGTVSKIDRADVKQAIMTSLYGSKAVPKEVFGEGEMLDMFLEVMNQEAPGIWQLNEALLALWNPEALIYEWTLPDNFHVKTKVMDFQHETVHFLERPYDVVTKINTPTETGKSLPANITHSIDGMIVREISRRCTYDRTQMVKAMGLCFAAIALSHTSRPADKISPNISMVRTLTKNFHESGFLSARIVDYIDEDSIHYAPLDELFDLLDNMPKHPFPVLSIHDCFRVHPNYGNDLRKQYNMILSELAQSSLLQSIVSQIVGEDTVVSKFGDISEQIVNADYALS